MHCSAQQKQTSSACGLTSTGKPNRLIQEDQAGSTPDWLALNFIKELPMTNSTRFCVTRAMLLAKSAAMFSITLAAVTLLVHSASAQDCQHCGCKAGGQKVCRLVCEEKKVEVTCWSSKDESFCLPGPSQRDCRHCEDLCESCNERDRLIGLFASPKPFVWTEWIPGCATLHTKRKLMKRTVTKKIPSYKWVVEDLCETCESKLPKVTVASDAALPPVPNVDNDVRVVPVSVAPIP